LATSQPARWLVIDAAQPLESVVEAAWSKIQTRTRS
jgi:thymidylate kinase